MVYPIVLNNHRHRPNDHRSVTVESLSASSTPRAAVKPPTLPRIGSAELDEVEKPEADSELKQNSDEEEEAAKLKDKEVDELKQEAKEEKKKTKRLTFRGEQHCRTQAGRRLQRRRQ